MSPTNESIGEEKHEYVPAQQRREPTTITDLQTIASTNPVSATSTTTTTRAATSDAYKEYAYSPVPVSIKLSSSVYLPTTLPVTTAEDNDNRSDTERFRKKRRTEFELDMEEAGSQVPQYVAAVAANLCIFAGGAMMGWTSPVNAYLVEDPDKPGYVDPKNPLGKSLTLEEGSWVGSIMTLGAVAGSLISGYLGERFGRKRALLFSTVPYLIGWVLIATANSLELIYAARFIFGVAISIVFTIVPMYCGEIAETNIRGVLGSFLQLFVTIGLLYSYCIGPYVSYVVFWILCGALPIVFFVIFMFMPESPYYLISKGMKSEATDALSKLRGKSESGVQKELDEIQTSVDEAFSTEVKITDLFTVKANFKALLYTCAAVSFQQLTGINVVLFYAQQIFKDTGTPIDPAVCTIIIGVVQICASCVTPIVVDRLGRRILLIASGIGTAVSTGALGMYFLMKDYQKMNMEDLGWLPIASLVVFMCLYCIGWGPLPWAIMGEMFSAEVKAKASGITVLVCWALAFIITKYFSNIGETFGQYTAFWIFTVCSVISVVFTVLILPETKGKTLRQIQDELNGVKSIEFDVDGEAGQNQSKH